MKMFSKDMQTTNFEAYHSTINNLAPKIRAANPKGWKIIRQGVWGPPRPPGADDFVWAEMLPVQFEAYLA